MRMLFKEERNRDLFQAYEQVLKENKRLGITMGRYDLIECTIDQPAKRFYVTFDEARRNIVRLLSGKSIGCRNRHKLMMYHDLTEIMEKELRKNPLLDFNQVLFHILSHNPAPRFYLSIKTAYKILNKMIKERDLGY